MKIFVRASKPGPRCKKAFADGAVEMYNGDRFFTVTGQRLPNTPADVKERQPECEAVYEFVFGGGDAPKPAPPPSAESSNDDRPHLDDDEIIRRATQRRQSGAKFAALWAG